MRDELFNELGRIQQWMQAAIMHPEGVAGGIQSPAAQEHLAIDLAQLEEIVTRSSGMSAIDRLQIYGNAYFARLIECLRDGFPVLRHAVGDEAFDAFSFGYLQSHPSTTYTLMKLGCRFPQYLADTAPDTDDMPGHWFDFVVELARFELAVGQVFDGPGSEGGSLLSATHLLAIPPEQLLKVRLATTPSLQLMALMYPVHRYYEDHRRGVDAVPPGREEIHLALVRNRFLVRHHELSKAGYQLLTRLAAGESLGSALAGVVSDGSVSAGAISQGLRSWFQEWAAEGFFCRADC